MYGFLLKIYRLFWEKKASFQIVHCKTVSNCFQKENIQVDNHWTTQSVHLQELSKWKELVSVSALWHFVIRCFPKYYLALKVLCVLRPKTQIAGKTKFIRYENQLHEWSVFAKNLSGTLRKIQILTENLHAYLGKVSFISKRPL